MHIQTHIHAYPYIYILYDLIVYSKAYHKYKDIIRDHAGFDIFLFTVQYV